jgi:hypothetical protein
MLLRNALAKKALPKNGELDPKLQRFSPVIRALKWGIN